MFDVHETRQATWDEGDKGQRVKHEEKNTRPEEVEVSDLVTGFCDNRLPTDRAYCLYRLVVQLRLHMCINIRLFGCSLVAGWRL